MSAVRLDLHLLGLFCLLRGDQPVAGFDQARLQHLLAYLVLHCAAPVSRQQLASLFWPASMDQQALKNLRTLPTRVRHALRDANHFIAVTSQTIQRRPEAPLTLGAADFETAVAQAIGEWPSDAFLRPRLAALEDARLVEVACIVLALLAERPHLAPPGPHTEAWQRTRLTWRMLQRWRPIWRRDWPGALVSCNAHMEEMVQ